MLARKALPRWLVASGLVCATGLLSACGSDPVTVTTERTTTTTTGPADPTLAPPAVTSTTTTTHTQTPAQ